MEHIWHSLGREEVLERLKTTIKGLDESVMAEQEARWGANALPVPQRTGYGALFARQFRSSLVSILLIAAAISFALQDFLDANVILAAVLLNVLVGFFQENQAERAFLKVRSFMTFKALV